MIKKLTAGAEFGREFVALLVGNTVSCFWYVIAVGLAVLGRGRGGCGRG